jgi:hypothetical protein
MSVSVFPKDPEARAPQEIRTNRSIGARMVRFLPLLAIVALGFAVLPNTGCGKGYNEVSTVSPTATPLPTAVPSATATLASQSFNLRGSLTRTGAKAGTCSGQKCSASAGDCECLTFSGTLLSTVVGNLAWTASVTINLDDCTATGTSGGSCCNSDGLFNAVKGSGASASTLVLSFTGPECVDANSAGAASLQANFAVLPASSTKTFANSTGTGLFNLYSNATDGSGYVSALGAIHLAGK